MAINSGDGFDPKRVNPDAEYTLQQLAGLFPFGVQLFRQEIKNRRLKARKKGKFFLVKGSSALNWWKKE